MNSFTLILAMSSVQTFILGNETPNPKNFLFRNRSSISFRDKCSIFFKTSMMIIKSRYLNGVIASTFISEIFYNLASRVSFFNMNFIISQLGCPCKTRTDTLFATLFLMRSTYNFPIQSHHIYIHIFNNHLLLDLAFQPIKCQCCPHIETSQLICIANQLTGVSI